MAAVIARKTLLLLKQAFREEARRETRKHQPVSAKHVRNVHAFIKSVLKEQDIEMPANIPLPDPRKKPVAIPPAEMLLPALIGTDIELPCLLGKTVVRVNLMNASC